MLPTNVATCWILSLKTTKYFPENLKYNFITNFNLNLWIERENV